jgi:hypothetical protein
MAMNSVELDDRLNAIFLTVENSINDLTALLKSYKESNVKLAPVSLRNLEFFADDFKDLVQVAKKQ